MLENVRCRLRFPNRREIQRWIVPPHQVTLLKTSTKKCLCLANQVVQTLPYALSLSLLVTLQARKCVRRKDPGNKVAIHPSPLSHKCEEMLPYPGTSMGRELLHADYFSDARSKAVHCVCSTPAGVF